MANEGIAYADIRASLTLLDGDLAEAKAKFEALFAEIDAQPVSFSVTANTAEADAALSGLQETATVIAAEPIVITPVVDIAVAEASVAELSASLAEAAFQPVDITPIVNVGPAIASLEALDVAKVESNAIPIVPPAAAQEVENVGFKLSNLGGFFRGASSGAREFNGVLNGSVSGSARAASGISQTSGALGFLGVAIGAATFILPPLIEGLTGMKDAQDKVAVSSQTAALALNKSTEALLRNKSALGDIATAADAVKVAQDFINNSFLNTADVVVDGVNKTQEALGKLSKSPEDVQPLVAAIKNVTAAQLEQTAALGKAITGQQLGAGIAQFIAEAQNAALQITGITETQASNIAVLATHALTSIGSTAADTRSLLLDSGLSSKQIDDYTSSVKQLVNVADAVDLSHVVDEALALAAGSSDLFNNTLLAQEGILGINRSTTDASKAQTLYTATIQAYAKASNDATAADKASKDAKDKTTEATKAQAEAVETAGFKFKESQDASEQAVLANTIYTETVKEQADASKANEDATTAMAKATKDAADAAATAAKNEKTWNDAIAGLDGPAARLTGSLSFIKQELDGLSGTKLDLDQATEAVTRFFADLNDKKNKTEKFNVKFSFDTSTVGGANNFDVLTKGLDTFKAQVVAEFGATGDIKKAVGDFSTDISKLKVNFVAGGKTPAEKAKLAKEFDDEIAQLHLSPVEIEAALKQGTIDELQKQIDKLPDDVNPDTKLKLQIELNQGDVKDVQTGLDDLKKDPSTGAARVASIFAQAEGVPTAQSQIDAVSEKDYLATVNVQPAGVSETELSINDITQQDYTAIVKTQADNDQAAAEIAAFVAQENANAPTITYHTRVVQINESGGYRAFDAGGYQDNGNLGSHYASGNKATAIYGEPSTSGEFFLSMAPQFAELNRRLATAAVDRLGGRADFGQQAHSSAVDLSPVLGHLASMVDRLAEVRDMPPMLVSVPSSDPSHVASKMHWSVQARRKHSERSRV